MKAIKDELGEFVRQTVGREPMVVPMYVYITKNGNPPQKRPVGTKPRKVVPVEQDDPAGMTIEEQGGE